MTVLDVLLKCDLRSRKNTHCYGWPFRSHFETLRLGPSNGAETRELQEIDGNGGWGTYKNDGKRYADFLGGTLHIWGEGKSKRYWIELPSHSKVKKLLAESDVVAEPA